MIARRAVLAGGVALAAAFALPAAAHQQKRTISTIARNPRSGRIEIMHQVPVHDLSLIHI